MIARRTTAPRKAATIVAKKPSVVLGSKRFITSPARNAPTRPTTIMPSSKASTQLTSLVLSGASIRSKCHESVMSIVMESGSLRTERLCHLSI